MNNFIKFGSSHLKYLHVVSSLKTFGKVMHMPNKSKILRFYHPLSTQNKYENQKNPQKNNQEKNSLEKLGNAKTGSDTSNVVYDDLNEPNNLSNNRNSSKDNSDFAELYDKAVTRISQGRYFEALQSINACLEIFQIDKAFMLKSIVLAEMHRDEEALAVLNRLLGEEIEGHAPLKKKEWPEGYFLKLKTLIKLTKIEEALSFYRQLIQHEDYDHNYILKIELLLMDLAEGLNKKSNQKIRDLILDTVLSDITVERQTPERIYHKARILANQKLKYEEALNLYSEIIEKFYNEMDNNMRSKCFLEKAICLFHLKQHDLCLYNFDKAIEFASREDEFNISNDKLKSILLTKAVALCEMKQYSPAIQIYDKLLSYDYQFEYIHFQKAEALLKNGNTTEALEAVDKGLDINPSLVYPLILKATILAKLGQYDESLKLYDRAIKKYPKNWKALIGRAIVYSQMGNFEMALTNVNVARLANPSFSYEAAADRLRNILSHKQKLSLENLDNI